MKNHWLNKKSSEIANKVNEVLVKIEANFESFDTDAVHAQCMAEKLEQLDKSIYANVKEFLINLENEPKIEDMDCGDLFIKDSGSLGFDVYRKDTGEKLLFLNSVAEQALVAWLLKKHEHDEKWFVSTVQKAYPKNYSGFPLDDALSLQQGDFGSQANLDIFYSSQFVQNEEIDSKYDTNILVHTPVLEGTLSGEVVQEGKSVQSFNFLGNGRFKYELHGAAINWPDSYIKDGTLNCTTGEITFTWFGESPKNTKVVVCYEFNMEH